MSREIKFRVWHKPTNQFVRCHPVWDDEKYTDLGLLSLTSDGELIFETMYDGFQRLSYRVDDFIVQQYTGLKDMNGVEIYEGDIVRSGFSTAVVEWDDDIDQDFYWGNACGFRFNFDPETMNPNGDYEVIGNIFEGVDNERN